MKEQVIIFSAPSGSGKSTVVSHLLKTFDFFELSISATSRAPRGTEKDGIEYYFITPEEFRSHIQNDDFVEYEEVYADRYYGTLKSQVGSQLDAGQNVVFDVDVNGGMRIKEHYGSQALSIFIMPPSIETLRSRLENRGTDAPEVIAQRIARAEYEISQAVNFDCQVVNDDLETAKKQVFDIISNFLKG